MPKHPFLSDPWMAEASDIRKQYQGRIAAGAHVLKMNLVINSVPFGEGTIRAHMDSSEGEPRLDLGHLDMPDVSVTTDYETAKTIFIDGNPQAGMQAFMAGKVQVQGDMTKLMTGMQQPPDPVALEMQQKIRDITE